MYPAGALNIESNLARPVSIQIPSQSPGRYTAELPLRRIKLFSFQANLPYVPSTHTLWISHTFRIVSVYWTSQPCWKYIVNMFCNNTTTGGCMVSGHAVIPWLAMELPCVNMVNRISTLTLGWYDYPFPGRQRPKLQIYWAIIQHHVGRVIKLVVVPVDYDEGWAPIALW